MAPGRQLYLHDVKSSHAILSGIRQWTTSVNIKRAVTGHPPTLAHKTPSPSLLNCWFFGLFLFIKIPQGTNTSRKRKYFNWQKFTFKLLSEEVPIFVDDTPNSCLPCPSSCKRLLPKVATGPGSSSEWDDFLCNHRLRHLLLLNKHCLALGCCFDGRSPVLVCFPRQRGHDDGGLNVQQTRF